MKRIVRFIQDVEIDTETSACRVINGFVEDGKMVYIAQTDVQHIKNADVVLRKYNSSLDEYLRRRISSSVTTH